MDTNVAVNDVKQYIILKFDSEQYGIDITYIENIVRVQPITRVPHSQPYFLGIINLRGEVVPVMSMRRKFDLPDKENTNASRILILKIEGSGKIGILVDEVREVVTLEESQIEQIAAENIDTRTYLMGIGKYNNTLISLINISMLISDIDSE